MPPNVITLKPDEVAAYAVSFNPLLVAERTRRGEAQAQLVKAGILPNPQLAASLDVPYHASAGDRFTAGNIGVNWEVTSLLRRRGDVDAASANLQSVDLDIAWKEWQTAQAAKIAAYDLVAAREALNAANAIAEDLVRIRALVQSQLERHDKTLLDFTAADSAAQDAAVISLAQAKDVKAQSLLLARAIGVEPDTVAVSESPLPEQLSVPNVSELLATFERERFDLLALRKGYESQEDALRAAILAQFPKIGLGFTTGRDTADVRSYGLGISVDIPVFDRNQGVIAAETATRQRLYDEFASRVYTARCDIASAIDAIRASNAQIAATRPLIAKGEELIRTYEAAVGRGDADVVTLYAARSSLAQRRLDLIKLKQTLIDNWIALEIAAGRTISFTEATTRTAAARTEP